MNDDQRLDEELVKASTLMAEAKHNFLNAQKVFREAESHFFMLADARAEYVKKKNEQAY